MGQRGAANNHAAGKYGAYDSVLEYMDEANEKTIVIIMIEDKSGFENLTDILKVPNIDVIAIGPLDLAAVLGHPGDPGHPEIQAVFKEIFTKAREAGIIPGATASSIEHLKSLLKIGVRYLPFGHDVVIFQKWAKGVRSDFDDVVKVKDI